jgi:hypothetical protein
MSTTVNGTSRTFTATGTMSAYILSKIDNDGSVSTATKVASGETRVGFTTREVLSAGDSTSIALLNGGGTAYGIAAGTITNAGTALYGATSGKVGTVASGGVIGFSVSSAVADDVIEILVHPSIV